MTIEQLAKKYTSETKEIQAAAELLFKLMLKQSETGMAMFKLIEKADCLYSDSPLSSVRAINNLRRYLAKLGWSWAISLPYGTSEVKTYVQERKEGPDWAMKFAGQEIGVKKIL